MPFFIPPVGFSGCLRGILVKPFFDSNPTAVVSVVASDGISGLIVWASIFRDVLNFGAGELLQNLPGCWSFGQFPEAFKGFINLAPDLGRNT